MTKKEIVILGIALILLIGGIGWVVRNLKEAKVKPERKEILKPVEVTSTPERVETLKKTETTETPENLKKEELKKLSPEEINALKKGVYKENPSVKDKLEVTERYFKNISDEVLEVRVFGNWKDEFGRSLGTSELYSFVLTPGETLNRKGYGAPTFSKPQKTQLAIGYEWWIESTVIKPLPVNNFKTSYIENKWAKGKIKVLDYKTGLYKGFQGKELKGIEYIIVLIKYKNISGQDINHWLSFELKDIKGQVYHNGESYPDLLYFKIGGCKNPMRAGKICKGRIYIPLPSSIYSDFPRITECNFWFKKAGF